VLLFAEICSPLTRQVIELESCSTLNGFSKSFTRNRKNTFFVSGGPFFEVTSQRRHVLEILATFGRPCAQAHWLIPLTQCFVDTNPRLVDKNPLLQSSELTC